MSNPEKISNEQTAQQSSSPSVSVLAQYLKDFSFENPNAPHSLAPSEAEHQVAVSVNVQSRGLSDTDVEVDLKIEAKATRGSEMVIFVVEVVYSGIFKITGASKEVMQFLLLTECPRFLFPFVRQSIAEATRNGGFAPLLLDPIDFAALYQNKANSTEKETGSSIN